MSEYEFGQPYLSKPELLSLILNQGIVTPRDLAASRRRENVIRSQLRELCDEGWLVEFSQGLFHVSESGYQFLIGSNTRWKEDISPTVERITDLSELDAETIKQFNMELYESPNQQYGLVDDSPAKTVRRIENVKESRLDRLLEEFPTNEHLCEQCAHWARAISGKHFFPDANHRTAMASLSALLDLNEIPISNWPGRDIERTVLKAKFARIFLVDVRFDTLWKRDELFQVWHRHFRNLLYDVSEEQYRDVSLGRLRRALNAAREER